VEIGILDPICEDAVSPSNSLKGTMTMNRKRIRWSLAVMVLPCLLATSASAQTSAWQPVTGAETLRGFMSGTKAERELPSGEISRGEYFPDGTGILFAWGASIPRTWSVKGEDQVCITAERETQCYQFELNSKDPTLYRARDINTDETAEFRITEGTAVALDGVKVNEDQGSVATPSASELAAELSNPNTAVATLNFKNQFRWFEGDLPKAGNQSGYTLLFQPVLPFVLESGAKIIWRPAIPMIFDQPLFSSDGKFSGKSGLGDIAFDLAYAPKMEGGLLLAYGLIASMPTASNDLGTDRWTLGPELLLGKVTPEYVAGIFPNHQWDIGGSGDKDINLTSTQLFYTYLPGGGWSVGSAPTVTYDWTTDQWTVPLQLNLGKTVIRNGRPWKFSVELNYYLEKPDAFGPEWMLSLNVAPVVKNGLASWFGL
jgi:hypothetical protein